MARSCPRSERGRLLGGCRRGSLRGFPSCLLRRDRLVLPAELLDRGPTNSIVKRLVRQLVRVLRGVNLGRDLRVRGSFRDALHYGLGLLRRQLPAGTPRLLYLLSHHEDLLSGSRIVGYDPIANEV